MSRLFDRAWRVTLGTIEFTELDCDFQIAKTARIEPNTCELTVYNLNREHQAELEELRPREQKATTGIPCRIEAGYAEPGPELIWLGDLLTLETRLEGPDWVTRATSGDGQKGWENAKLHVAYGPGTPIETALRAMARELGVGVGNLSKVVQQIKIAGSSIFPTGKSFAGSASRALRDFARSANLDLSIQNGALQVLERGKALSGEALRLSSETGLIGSPSVDNAGNVTCQVMMIPGLQIGRVLVLDAIRVKGNYKIDEIVWSGSTSGDAWGAEITASRY
jgi:hypothetical protein